MYLRICALHLYTRVAHWLLAELLFCLVFALISMKLILIHDVYEKNPSQHWKTKLLLFYCKNKLLFMH